MKTQTVRTINGVTYPVGTEVELIKTTSYGIATVKTATGVLIEIDIADVGIHR